MLLITGTAASGKTRLANLLRDRIDAPLLAKDLIKEQLFDQLGSGDAGWSRRLSNASFSVLFALAPTCLRRSAQLLLEGNFRVGEHETALAAVLQSSGAQLGQILCHASEGTRARRLAARYRDPARHPGHADAQGERVAEVEADFLQLPGRRWRFDSDQPWDDELERLLRPLEQWLTPSRD